MFFPEETGNFGFIGCGERGKILNFATACVNYGQYLSSSSLYDKNDYIKKWYVDCCKHHMHEATLTNPQYQLCHALLQYNRLPRTQRSGLHVR